MANYNSQYTGRQIDSAVGKANNPDSTPTANSGNLVTSAGVKSAIEAEKTRAQTAEAAIRGFGQVASISAGANLNDYQTLGCYYCTTTPSQSVGNNPVPGTAFTLQVMERSNNGVTQILFSGANAIYVRTSNLGVWTAWYKFDGVAV